MDGFHRAWGNLHSQVLISILATCLQKQIAHKDPLLKKGTGQLVKLFLVLLTWLKLVQSQKPNPNRQQVSVHQILLAYLAAC